MAFLKGLRMKEIFDRLHTIMSKVNSVEDDLQVLRDMVEIESKAPINESILGVYALRDLLWKVDKSLEIRSDDARNAEKLLGELDSGETR